MCIVPWDPDYKLYLLKEVLVGPVNSAWDPPKEMQTRIVTQTRCYPNPLKVIESKFCSFN